MTPAIHAKLQQAHNKLLAHPSQQEDTAAVSARPSTSKPAPKKGRAAAQPDPAAGLYTRASTALLLYADQLSLPSLCTTIDDLILPALHTMSDLKGVSDCDVRRVIYNCTRI